MYAVGGPYVEDKDAADRAFLNNMVRIIDSESTWVLKPLRRWRAMSYYTAVKDFGGPAYWKNKNPDENLG